MCGFAGFLTFESASLDGLEAVATRMADAIAHRGPDDAGAWADAQAGVAFGHRRLSIIDLSPAGHQPMVSAGGRYVIAFNGEIYNHLELRGELEAGVRAGAGAGSPHPCPLPQAGEGARHPGGEGVIPWRGHSDTETLLAGFEAWGIEATLQKTVGMFAIALWDRQDRVLTLARDRFGEKPLYYGWAGPGGARAFVFGSELKALRAYPGFANPVCREALAQYMRFMVVPAPRSIYQGIYKLEPGCLLTVRGAPPAAAPALPLRPGAVHESLSVRRWWSLADVVQAGAVNPITDETEALQALEAQLSQAVKAQSLADVPLGAFLSGGVDSSAIVALMQKQATQPVKTFTIGFEEAAFDESPHARAVAQHLGTEHTELFVTVAEAQGVIPRLPVMYDEPFADSSQIPTHLVCHAARQHVTVALSGDAGDELFGGYNRYFWGPRIWNRLAWLPYPVRQALGAAIAALPVAGWDGLGRPLNALMPGTQGIARVGDKAHKLAARLRGVRNLDDLYLSLVSEWQDPAAVVKGSGGAAVVEPPSALADPLPALGADAGPLRMMFRDSLTYLPDDILCKVDRAAMATSLETRVPFLDHRVAELAWRLPLHMKIRGNEGKWALRQVLYKHVPRELIERPKAGFGIPVGQWLRGPLRDWAESLLDARRLQAEGYFHPAPIRARWAEHLSGQRDHTTSLWAVLMFQAWLEEQTPQGAAC
ncbi:MAG: asparagine synthase (glutamine-hydrolyzing) [Hydrogenophaga sp.]|nr:asparagine synthase (glutamine-hydrolyzing) [Hydrogenophaga sp.]MDP2163201.1 asparagine synthase (glutamine-hydrolyzing) [Hydrogenophaga sp.]MDP3476298.1 asparagine synthase (glutamine-hydrolyzing) [Hydrogenophaga sp.]